MNILFFGDIVGRIGLEAVSDSIEALVKLTGASLVIANGENVSRGRGITESDYRLLTDIGIDAITLGNHWHDKGQIDDFIKYAPCLVRPANVIGYQKGSGVLTLKVGKTKIAIINLLCQAFMKEEVLSPSEVLNDILQNSDADIHIIDIHGESTSEKATLAYAFDGTVTAVLGTHTHVQTSDERVLPHGTAFISDVGMNGAYQSIIGFEPETTVRKMIYGDDIKLSIAGEGIKMVNAVLIDVDEETGLCRCIKPICLLDGKSKYGKSSLQM